MATKMELAQLDGPTILKLIQIIDKTPAVTWTGQGGVKERLQSIHNAIPVYDAPTELVDDSACGDYPAPCNCDNPETHNGH